VSYLNNTELAVVENSTFVVLKPKRVVSGFTNYSGNTWVANFDHGYVSSVFVDGVRYNLQTTLPLSSATFFHDESAGLLYVYSTTDPDVAKYVVAKYDLYFSNEGRNFYRDPLDFTSTQVPYEGLLSADPNWSQQSSEILFGFFPLTSSSLRITNTSNYLTRHLYDSSWYLADCAVYHMLGEELEANVRCVFRGYLNGFNLANSEVNFNLDTYFRAFEKEYLTQKYFNIVDFPNVDPAAIITGSEWPIRKVYGRYPGLAPVNIQFGAASTVNNRYWVTQQGQTFKASINRLIDTGGTNNATNTTLTNADGIMPGDMLRINHSVGSSYSVLVTGIDYTTKIVTHAAIGARTVTVGDSVDRSFIARVRIRDRNGAYYDLYPVTHWNEDVTFNNNSSGFVLVNDFEAAVSGFPSPFDPAQDEISCDVYGETFIQTYKVAATPVTTVNQRGGNLNNIAAIIYNLLREVDAVENIVIDETSFAAAVTGRNNLIGYTIPKLKDQHKYPTYREIFADLIRTGLMRLQINNFNSDTGIGLSILEPVAGTADKTITPYEFYDFRNSVNYDDVYSSVRVIYDQKDVNTTLTVVDGQQPNISYVTDEINVAKYLHGISRRLEIDCYIVEPLTGEIENYADRILFAVSDRRSQTKVSGRSNLLPAELGETYQVDRESLPGYSFIEGTNQTRKYMITESEKSTGEVVITLEDQKGIEDNSGSW
jgi:hypothetical protein